MDIKWLCSQFPDLRNIVPLAQGGFKVVFTANHATDGEVVLKIIKPSNPAEIGREIRAVREIQSPRIPKIFADGIISTPLGKFFWFREQKINGLPVNQILSAGPMEGRDVLKLGLHVLEVLEKAEQAKIVHRDIKPANLIRANDGCTWVLDFGIARHLSLDSLTPTGAPGRGTAGYAPPEQVKNLKREIDSRTDLFALGVTLFECATGINPFSRGAFDQYEVLRRAEMDELPRLPPHIGSIGQFQDLIDSMTQKRPSQRVPTAREALEWLRSICVREGIS